MDSNALNKVITKRQEVWAKAQEHIDTLPEDDDRAEHTDTWDRYTAELDDLDKRIAEFRDIAEREAVIEEARSNSDKLAERHQVEAPEAPESVHNDETLLRSLIGGDVRAAEFHAPERRDLTVGTATAGGNTVPTSFYAVLQEHLIENSAIRQTRAQVLTTGSGEALQVPKTTDHGTASLVAEGGAIAEDDPAFGQVTLDAFKYATIIQVSSELLADTGVDMVNYLGTAAGRNLGNASGTDFVVGDGSAKPNGVMTASTLGVTAAAVAAITSDEVIDLYFSVTSPYRMNGEWLIGDSALSHIRKLKDTTDQYLWQPSLTGGEPDRILGKPYVVDPNVADLATGAKTLAFGDFSTYMIRDVGMVRAERSDDFAFANDLVSYRFILRTDGDLIDTTGAIKHLIQA